MFILGTAGSFDIPAIGDAFKRYYAYLDSVKEKLPRATYEYAVAPWHYDFSLHDPRCPHDAWVESITIKEIATKDDASHRKLDIFVCLLNAYNNGYIEFHYHEVSSYTFHVPDILTTALPQSPNSGHHDWLIDEIRLSNYGLVIHEVDFALGSHWLIECKELSHSLRSFSTSLATS